MNKKNIVIDCEKMRHANTGFYFFCKNLARNIIQQSNKETENITLYLPKNEHKKFNCASISFNSLHKLYLPISNNIHLWHSSTQMSNYLPSTKIDILLTIHDLNALYENNRANKIKESLKKIQQRANRAKHIVTISNYVKNDVLSHLTVDEKKISVIYNGCNIPEIVNFENPKFKPSHSFLFAIGSINLKKNFHVLPCLLKNNDYDLIISGVIEDEDYKQKIIDEAIKHNVLNRIFITGAISDNDKYWYFKNCAAFLFPSLAEGFGLPVIEAMYFGKPVFLSTKTSLPEIGGNDAFYFDVFDSGLMQKIFNESMLCYQNDSAIAEKLTQRALSFSWKNAAQQYLQLYRSL